MYDDLYGESYNDNWYSVIPIAFLVFFIPLIVYGKMIDFQGDYYKYWNGTTKGLDFFSYYKSIWILILSGICILVFAVKLFNKSTTVHRNKIYIPMAIYSLLVILSTIFSDLKEIALWGFVERYEGMLVIIAYMIIMFVTMNLVENKTSIKIILIALISSAVIIAIIGILQYFGHDFFKSMTGKKFILPREYQNLASKLKFQFGDKIIYSTLYHYNYVGSYMAMLFPLTFTIFLFIKNKSYKIIIGIVSLLMFANLILCYSRGGVIGGGISVLVLFVATRDLFIKKWKMSITALSMCILVLIGFNIYSKGMLINSAKSMLKDIQSLTKNSSTVTLKDVIVRNNEIQIVTSNSTLKIVSNLESINFIDGSGKIINSDFDKETGVVILNSNNYKNYNIKVNDYSTSSNRKYTIQIINGSYKMIFLNDNNYFSFLNEKGEAVQLRSISKWGFEGKETLGSARGYIWSRSIPMLKNVIILGYGPDTFAAKFPQDDYIGKLIAYGTSQIVVDKPHNLYLQSALSVGILGLIAFLIMINMYFYTCFKLYSKNNFNDFDSIISLAIFSAICGYLVSGLFNDSVVSVAPVFWVLFGMGIVVNEKCVQVNLGKNSESKN